MAILGTYSALHWVDYLVLAVTLVVSVGIGVFHSCNQKSTEEYLIANRKVKVLPAAASLMISYLSAITLLGDTTELYFYGITFGLYIFATWAAVILCVELFVPLFYPLKITSVQEYMMMRFGSRVVVLYSFCLQLFTSILLCGLFLYGPSVMLHTVCGFPVWASILVLGICSTFYSTVGGFTGVLWTDFFQTLVIFGAMATIAIKGTIAAGGIKNVWSTYSDGGRLDIKIAMSPFNRQDLGTMTFIHAMMRLTAYGSAQIGVQRFCALSTLREAKLSVLLVIPALTAVAIFTCYSGVLAYSFYATKGCDPYKAGYISSMNEMLPYFAMDILDVPGLPGLFVACIFCGSLSSLSSNFNSMAAMAWKDVLNHSKYCEKLTERGKTRVTKSIVIIGGILSTGFGLLVMQMKGSIMKMAFTVLSPSGSGLFFIIFAGAVSRKINAKNVLICSIITVVAGLWVTIGAQTIHQPTTMLPTDVSRCSNSSKMTDMNNTDHNSSFDWRYAEAGIVNNTEFDQFLSFDLNITQNVSSTRDQPVESLRGIEYFYGMSHMWYIVWCVMVGSLASFTLSFVPGLATDNADPKLLFPQIRWCMRIRKPEYQLTSNGDMNSKTNDINMNGPL